MEVCTDRDEFYWDYKCLEDPDMTRYLAEWDKNETALEQKVNDEMVESYKKQLGI